MDVPFRENGSFRFDRFRVDPLRRTLLYGEERIALQGRAFDTLAYLVANADRVVTRAELFEAVWLGRVVDENNLGQAIYALRRSLRDQAGEALILTVAGRGYRIGVPVAFEPYEMPTSASMGFRATEQPASLLAPELLQKSGPGPARREAPGAEPPGLPSYSLPTSSVPATLG